jgi:predicted DNA-binding protein (UPF0251 family)
MEIVEISYPEIESLRLVDLEGLTQEEAAARMGISRRSLWSDLNKARKKVAYALSKGCAIQITGKGAEVQKTTAKNVTGSEKDA